VGRAAECADLTEWMGGAAWNVLYLSGPGGIGKTTLLNELAWQCGAIGVACRRLDGSVLDATPEGFRQAVGDATVVLVDGWEGLQPIERWLVEHFLPELPERTLLVLASRQDPSPAWRLNTAVWQLTRHRGLANFTPEESEQYLSRRDVPTAWRADILGFTHGHPLATAVAVDAALQRGGSGWGAVPDPDVVRTLLDHFVDDTPSERHERALEACAVLHRTTEGVLEAVLGGEVGEVFRWLHGLSFVDARPDGLAPHDTVREVLVSDLRWRHPQRLADLHAAARKYYHARIASQPSSQDVIDLIWLHRDNPLIKPFLDWKKATDFLLDRYRTEDHDALVEMTIRHEGSADWLQHWLERHPEGAQVVRDSAGPVRGYYLQVPLGLPDPDPEYGKVQAFLAEHGPLRAGEQGWYCRYWMDAAGHQGVSAVQSRIFLTFVIQALSTPQLAFQAITVHSPWFWAPAFAYAAASRIGDTGTFYFDWRRLPSYLWLELLGERELNPGAATRPVLDRAQFYAAVKTALKGAASVPALLDNPLLGCRLVGSGSEAERALTLQGALRQALDSLQARPRDAKLYRSLRVTYFEPAETQELAAQQLDVPFSTYRRHLTAGIERVQELLWQRELKRLQ
jgi:hypothetical protein